MGKVIPTFRDTWKVSCISFGIPPENVFVGGLRVALRGGGGAGKGFARSDNEQSDGNERVIPVWEDGAGLTSSVVTGNSACDEPGGSDIAEGCPVFDQFQAVPGAARISMRQYFDYRRGRSKKTFLMLK